MIKDLDQGIKQESLSRLFDFVTKFKSTSTIDSKIIATISIMHFETNKTLYNQMDKLTQRILWMKYEHEAKGKKTELEKDQ